MLEWRRTLLTERRLLREQDDKYDWLDGVVIVRPLFDKRHDPPWQMPSVGLQYAWEGQSELLEDFIHNLEGRAEFLNGNGSQKEYRTDK